MLPIFRCRALPAPRPAKATRPAPNKTMAAGNGTAVREVSEPLTLTLLPPGPSKIIRHWFDEKDDRLGGAVFNASASNSNFTGVKLLNKGPGPENAGPVKGPDKAYRSNEAKW